MRHLIDASHSTIRESPPALVDGVLQAGRLADGWIAEHILGWQPDGHQDYFPIWRGPDGERYVLAHQAPDGVWFYTYRDEVRGGLPGFRLVPSFTTEVGAAFSLLDPLRDRYWIDLELTPGSPIAEVKLMRGDEDGDHHWWAQGETLALAICRAVVQVKRSEG